MKTDLGDEEIAGFESQQFDFPARLARTGPNPVLETMVEAAVSAEAFPENPVFCYIVIVGHADRVDTQGLSSDQRRAQELESSTLRAESAQSWFFGQLADRLQAQGFTSPVDLASMRNVEIKTIACGAANLKEAPANEPARKNRRVRIFGSAFTPGP